MQKSLCILALALLVAAAPTAAKTPDGMPPSEETVCDGQVGAAYGLCTAYCEAMDCDSPEPNASATACSRVQANFLRHTGMPLPCDVACPCPEELPLFADFVDGDVPIVECSITSERISVSAADGQFSAVDSAVVGGLCRDNDELPGVLLTDAGVLVCRLLLRDTAASQMIVCVDE
ncbi:MAG TPA: hypothetical protein VE078_07750 [Thermoanaerobaculia bacterium]|nr:hypothetical protein [Thermoanaerobaculia bacterium]